MSHIKELPRYAFWYWPESIIYFPNNIEKINERPFNSNPEPVALIVKYDGSMDEFKEIEGSNNILKYQPYSKVVVKCIDGELTPNV